MRGAAEGYPATARCCLEESLPPASGPQLQGVRPHGLDPRLRSQDSHTKSPHGQELA